MDTSSTFNTLTTTLTHFLTVFDNAGRTVDLRVTFLLRIFVVIEMLAFFILGIAQGIGGGELLKKYLTLGPWVFFALHFRQWAKDFVNYLIEIGLEAGGSPHNYKLLLDPSNIASYGLKLSSPVLDTLAQTGSLNFSAQIIFSIAFLAILGAFMVLALQIFIAQIEFYLTLVISAVAVPFGAFSQTKFIADKAIGATVSAGFKLMTLAVLLAIIQPSLDSISYAHTPVSYGDVAAVLFMCILFPFLAFKLPDVVTGFLSGSAALGASQLMQGARSLVGLGVAAASTAVSGGATALTATRAAANAGGRGAVAGAQGLGFVSGAAKGGVAAARADNTLPTPANDVRAAAAGIGRAFFGAASQGGQGAVQAAASPMSNAFRRGAANAQSHLRGATAGGSAESSPERAAGPSGPASPSPASPSSTPSAPVASSAVTAPAPAAAAAPAQSPIPASFLAGIAAPTLIGASSPTPTGKP